MNLKIYMKNKSYKIITLLMNSKIYIKFKKKLFKMLLRIESIDKKLIKLYN